MRYAYYTLAFLVLLTVSIMGFRGLVTTSAPVMVFPDMDNQSKYKPQASSKFFADGRADRPLPPGTVPHGRTAAADPAFLRADDAHYAGKNADGSFVRPVRVRWDDTTRWEDPRSNTRLINYRPNDQFALLPLETN